MTTTRTTDPNAPSMSRRTFAATVVGAAGWLAVPRLLTSEKSAPDYTLLSDVMVAMRDGVHLATDVYIPANAPSATSARFPVILERTPYNKTAPSRSERTPANPTPLGARAAPSVRSR